MNVSNFDFKIPEKLIAIKPVYPRDSSKLIVVSKDFKINPFSELLNILKKGDCLVINNTKVIPAHLQGEYEGDKINFTLNKVIKNNRNPTWKAFVKPFKKLKIGSKIFFNEQLTAKILNLTSENKIGEATIRFNCLLKNFNDFLEKNGSLALPSYITKKRRYKHTDDENYQTIFAKKLGAIAAPTASLHFSEKLLKKIKSKGIKVINVTLHVNGGTFIPIKTKDINNHVMHYEYGEISKNSAENINKVKLSGKKCIAIGTTVLRLLEASKDEKGRIKPFKGETNIFIKPGWKITTINGLVTNFHTPKSTLFVLICAMMGNKKAKELYKFAIKNKLRFFSYGDSCLIWN